jgi:hypothetical protein
MRRLIASLAAWAWSAEYRVAEAIDAHLDAGRFWRAAGACVALALLACNPWRTQ